MNDRVHVLPRLVLAVCGCLSAFALTGCGTEIVKQQEIQNDLAAAQQQAQLGKTTQARQWADRAIAVAPKDITTYFSAPAPDGAMHLGIVDLANGDYGVFSSVGDNASVVYYMTQAVRKFPDNSLPLAVLEEAQGRLGDGAGQRATAAQEAALIERQLTIPKHQISAEIIGTLAQAYWDAGDTARGAAKYRLVMATYPHDKSVAYAYNGLAYDYAVVNDKTHLQEALGLAKTALRLAPKLDAPVRDDFIAQTQDTVGWVQYRLGDYKAALVNVQKGVDAIPRSAECRYHLAMIYKALGNVSAARIELGYAVQLSQGYAAAQRELEKLPSSSSPVAEGVSGSA